MKELLQQILYALNQVPNKSFTDKNGKRSSTYDLAITIGKAIESTPVFLSSVTLYSDLMDEHDTFDALVSYPVKNISTDPSQTQFEQCDEDEAEMWSIFIHLPDGGLECIADCDTFETAISLERMLRIAGTKFIR